MILAVLSLLPVLQAPTEQAPRTLAQFQLDGKTQVVTADEVALDMAFHQRRKDSGKQAAEHLANTTIVATEATAKRLMPTDAEARAFWEDQKTAMRSQGLKPESQPVVRHSTEAELLYSFALHLANVNLVRDELRMKPKEQVSPDMLKLWLQEAKKRHQVTTDPDQLPLGTAARVDGQDISMLDLGRLLLRTSDDEEQQESVRRLVVFKTADRLAQQHGIELTDDELRAELKVRAAAATDPRYKGLSFEQLLKTQGLTPELLMHSPVFRAQLLERKLALKLNPTEALEARLARNRKAVQDELGARRRLGGIFVYALEKPNQLVRRDFPAAMAHLAELKKQLLAGRDFELMAKIETEDPNSKTRGGDLGFRHAREDQQDKDSLPDPVLDAAFALPVGGLSEPIRAPQGCWLIKVLAVEPEPSDAELVQRMRDQIVNGMSQQIVKDAKIQFAQ